VNDFLFQLAGETIAGDGAWEVALEHPDPATSTRSQVVRLQRQAMATSGNYRQFQSTTNADADAEVISHIIDPRTGSPVLRKFCSVTVIADEAATADAWATALFVLGPEQKMPFAIKKVIWQFGEKQ
jgi:thiamine biosynthesis lipoprotein